MNEMRFCQSCAMPLTQEADRGTNQDGSLSEEYCVHCYKDGGFLYECTMEEMIQQCLPFVSKGNPYENEQQARQAMEEMFPKLSRWRGQ